MVSPGFPCAHPKRSFNLLVYIRHFDFLRVVCTLKRLKRFAIIFEIECQVGIRIAFVSTTTKMENSSEPFDPLTGNQSLFDNPELSDVRFLIDDQTVYGHKQTLAMGSPVFKSMFFGDLKEDREVIEIKDLSSTGFMNALR